MDVNFTRIELLSLNVEFSAKNTLKDYVQNTAANNTMLTVDCLSKTIKTLSNNSLDVFQNEEY